MKTFKLMKLYIMLINILVVVENGKKYKGEKNVLWIYFNKLYVSYR